MNDNGTKKQLGAIGRKALEGRLVDALDELNMLSRGMGMWQVNSDVEKMQDNYDAMLRFMAAGADDPGRADLHDTIVAETMALIMRLSRELSMPLGSEIYYSTARTLLSHRDESIRKKASEYRDELQRLEDDFESLTDSRRTLRAEQLLREIFNRIWVTHPLSTDDFAAIDELMSSSVPKYARAMVISAMGLGHVSYYDSRRLAWLLARYVEYAESEPMLGLRALVEAMVSMVRYRRRPIAKAVKNVLAAARELPTWNKDFASVAIELMRAVGTDSISAKMKDGILGSLEEIDDELREKLKKGEIDLESIASEYNPEWADRIDQTKLGQNLREMAEIQAEGGDVFMTSFSQMKRYPFFHELPNWFLPFYESHSAVASADTPDSLVSTLLAKMPVLCDSDKYSLILSISSIPTAQREQLTSALRMQAEQMSESLSEVDKASGDAVRRNYINKYVQNLYRIVNLFRSKQDLYNYFNAGGAHPDLLQIDVLKDSLADDELYETVAEFYFRSRLWPEAAAAFAEVDRRMLPDARRTQQKGYAYERSGRLEQALESYDEAEMLFGDSEWTMRRLASVLRATGNFERAASYYKRLSDANPEDAALAIVSGEAYIDAEKPVEAEQAFHKAVYLSPESMNALRGLAYALFLNRKLERSGEIYDKIISMNPEADDYREAAMVKWAAGDIRAAIELFGKSTAGDADSINRLDAYLSTRHRAIEAAGGDISLHNGIIETLRFLKKQ